MPDLRDRAADTEAHSVADLVQDAVDAVHSRVGMVTSVANSTRDSPRGAVYAIPDPLIE